jgi:hypothetical protein
MTDVFLTGIALTGCLTLVLTLWTLSVAYLTSRKEQKLRAELETALRSLISSPSEDSPSPLAIYTDQAALLLAARLAQQFKTMLAGQASGEGKGERAEIEQAMVAAGPPWLVLLAGMIPKKLKTKLMKNPQMMGALAQMVQSSAGARNGGAAESQPRLLD